MDLVERDGELASLRGLLADASASIGRFALLSGPTACGKSTLARAFIADVERSGDRLLTAYGTRAEKDLPLGILSQLAQSAAQTDAWSAREARILADLVADAREHAEGDTLPVETRERVCETLLSLSNERLVVLVIDDIHHADRLSLQFLLYLAQRLKKSRLMLVMTALSRSHNCRAELLHQPHCHVIKLTPLTRRGVGHMARNAFGGELAEEVTADLYRLSGGNPLLLIALMEDLHESVPAGTGDRAAAAPGGQFVHAVYAFLHRAEPGVVDAAWGLAILGDDGPTSLLHHLLEADQARVRRSTSALRAAGLIANGRFRHSAIRRAILDEMPAGQRLRLHRRAAELFHEEGAPTPLIARHLLAATTPHDRWAMHVLIAAAERALDEDDVPLALECLRNAQHAASDDEERCEIVLRRVRAEWRVDPLAADRRLVSLVSSAASHDLSARQALAMVGPLVWHGRFAEAADVLGRVPEERRDVGRQTDIALRATRRWLRSLSPPLFRRFDDVLASARSADLSLLVADQTVRGTTALVGVLDRGPVEHAVSSAERTLETVRLDDETLPAIEASITALIYADRLERARRYCDVLLQEACDRKAPTWRGLLAGLRAEIARREGAQSDAIRYAQAALTYLPAPGWGVAVGLPLGTLLAATSAAGRRPEAEEQLRRPVPSTMFQTRFGLHYLHGRGHHYLATDRPHAALDDFLACGELMRDWELDLPALVPWRSDAAAAHLRLGHGEPARRLAEVQLARPGVDQGRTLGITLRTLAAASPLSRRPALLEAAVEALRAAGDRYELANALTDLGNVQQETGDHERGRASARRARALARECGAEPPRRVPSDLVPATGGLLTTSPPMTHRDARLSMAELRVAQLASTGATNRQIAERLHITISTVEQHLTQVYRKVKVPRRDDLRRVLGQQTRSLDIAEFVDRTSRPD
jgi:DNA-binding CsgD family transcriptional regulator